MYVNIVLQDCWARFTHAQHKLFQNAVGKFFLESFLKLCTCVLNCHLQVLVSTNPNGQYQPGFTEVGWTVPAKVTQDNSAPKAHRNKRVADSREDSCCVPKEFVSNENTRSATADDGCTKITNLNA